MNELYQKYIANVLMAVPAKISMKAKGDYVVDIGSTVLLYEILKSLHRIEEALNVTDERHAADSTK